MSGSLVVTGLDEVVEMMTRSPAKLQRGVTSAVTVNSRKVRDSARQAITGHAHLPAYPFSISYDITESADGAEGEIGPDKGASQGPLGNIVEFGTRNNAPLPHLGPALEQNADDLERGVEIAVAQALGIA